METFPSAGDALRRAQEPPPFDVVIADYRMPEMDGVTLLKSLRESQPQAVRMILSGQIDLDALADAINEAESFRFITKPCSSAELRLALDQALERHDQQQESQRLAENARAPTGDLDRQQQELTRLERESPGITQGNWGDDGSILLYDDD